MFGFDIMISFCKIKLIIVKSWSLEVKFNYNKENILWEFFIIMPLYILNWENPKYYRHIQVNIFENFILFIYNNSIF